MQDSANIETSIQNRLNTKFVGRQLHYYPSLTSTMEIARKIAQEEDAEGAVVITDEQTAGKGRLDRAWLSPKGSLSMSIILQPSLNNLPHLIMVASLAVVHAIKNVTALKAQIKWPNDILIKGKKVCGILIENKVKGSKVSFAIIGIGINVNFDPSTLPEVSGIATTLSHELGKEVSRIELTTALLTELEQLYLEAEAGAPLHKEWGKRMETLGKWIQVKVGESIEQGKAETVTENGNLILRCTDGSFVEIAAGDVTVIKN